MRRTLFWGVVKEGDMNVVKGRDEEGTLLKNGNILANGEKFLRFGRRIFKADILFLYIKKVVKHFL